MMAVGRGLPSGKRRVETMGSARKPGLPSSRLAVSAAAALEAALGALEAETEAGADAEAEAVAV